MQERRGMRRPVACWSAVPASRYGLIVLRSILDTVPLTLLLIAAVGFSVAVVLLAVWLIRRIVPATSEGFHAEISAPMVGVVAALFGLLLAFVIVIAYQNFLDADGNVSREADSLPRS
jgi:hypothetical protein